MITSTPRRLIGILGGMGPAATIDFMAKITANTVAAVDQEHIPLLVHSVPQIPDRSIAIQTGSDAPFVPMLAGVQILARAGADCIAIPCNTAHFWHERLSRESPIPILHIADAVSATFAVVPGRKGPIALMATRGTLSAGIYQGRLAHSCEHVITPDETVQRLIDETIAAVKGGRVDLARGFAQRAAAMLLDAGAEHLLLACTELPVAFSGAANDGLTIDCTNALARACVAHALGQLAPLPLPACTSAALRGSGAPVS